MLDKTYYHDPRPNRPPSRVMGFQYCSSCSSLVRGWYSIHLDVRPSYMPCRLNGSDVQREVELT